MKEICMSILILFIYSESYAQKSTLENINETTQNVIGLFKLKKTDESNEPKKNSSLIGEGFANPRKANICSEFCVENQSKKNSKITIEFNETEEKNQIIVMGKDRSCLFGIPFGIYTVRIYQEDKLTKKTEIKIDDSELYLLIIPD